jgi:hypothetical protein
MAVVNVNTRYVNWQPIVHYRIGINPASNPDPITGGLVVIAAQTQPLPAIFNVPITTAGDPGLGLANNFAYDPTRALVVGPTTITCRRAGRYTFSLQFTCLANIATPGNYGIFQIVRNGEAVFSGPPALSASGPFADLSGSPIDPYFNLGLFASGTAGVQLAAGDVITCVFYLAADSAVISLTSNISIVGA